MGLHNTWSGWRDSLLHAINAPVKSENLNFLNSWTLGVVAECANNPLSASLPGNGSKDCAPLAGSLNAQAYTDHAQGISRTAAQLESGDYPIILKALRNNNPYSVANNFAQAKQIAAELGTWGDKHWQQLYEAEVGLAITAPPGTGGGGKGGIAPGVHKGWHDLRRSIGRNLHKGLTDQRKLNAASLRSIHRASKVRI